MLLTVDWTSVWAMTGIGLGIVFAILVLLVLILQIFGFVAAKNSAPKAVVAQPAVSIQRPTADSQQPAANAEIEAAIATALYLYFHESHDTETYRLTIHHDDHPAWHSVLNNHLSNN